MIESCPKIVMTSFPFAHHNELSLLLGYEELKPATKHIPEYNLEKFLDIDLEEIFM